MSLFLKLKLLFSSYKKHEKVILKLNNQIRILNEENFKLKNKIESLNNKGINNNDNIIFKLKKERDKLKEELEKLKSQVESLNKGLKFKLFDNEIENKIIKELSLAKKEVNIAVAWITSKDLISKLEELNKNNIVLNIIVTRDREKENKRYYIESLTRLEKISNEFNVIDLNIKNPKYTNYMHNKYCIIDNNKVIDGSYNWSKNAMYNEEHIIVVESEVVAKLYKDNFDRLMKDYKNDRNMLIG